MLSALWQGTIIACGHSTGTAGACCVPYLGIQKGCSLMLCACTTFTGAVRVQLSRAPWGGRAIVQRWGDAWGFGAAAAVAKLCYWRCGRCLSPCDRRNYKVKDLEKSIGMQLTLRQRHCCLLQGSSALQGDTLVGIGVTAQAAAGNPKRHIPRRRAGPRAVGHSVL